ncbi:asparaginase domain-containing protein [Sedimenticola selenatireducens]|uniref:asparaginase domain-containing protein n=1 Tax=Sedimenticola selenatireducens TaxID=191960 RepID=UPI000491CCCB|nr:asparaginase domain-containing protein [Sedimenticola selenatireducens]
MKIKIYTTGGTIDKIYFDQKSEFQVGEPQILELLREANITFDFEVESLMRKDSLDMSDADRALIAERIRKDLNERILLTHGTDTMVETAKALVGIPGKTIVLVGSMQPARLRYSDAIFNIGYAVATVQMMPPGIYVAMNGQVFDPLHARKNVAGHRFEAI